MTWRFNAFSVLPWVGSFLAAFVMAGCEPRDAITGKTLAQTRQDALRRSEAAVEPAHTQAPPRSAPPEKKAKETRPPRSTAPMDNDEDEQTQRDLIEAERQARVRCFDDYCPCEETGPVDKMLCRNMRAGLNVDDQMLAVGAATRDSRKAIDDWNAAHPEQEPIR